MTVTPLKETSIQSLFSKQVAKSASSIALIFDEQQMTYGQLDYHANQLANYLKRLSVGSEILVGVCLDRSLDMVIALLGILKAGGACLPIDPSSPKGRLSFILNDAKAPVVITQGKYSSLFADQQIKVICVDSDREEIKNHPNAAPVNNPSPDDLAYVIYTSGSTGKPKGVMITYGNLSNFVRLASSALDVAHDDIYLQTAPITYIVSIRQLIIPLISGATVAIANSEQMRDPLKLFQLVKHHGITLMDMVPSFWRVCIQDLAGLPENEREELLDNSVRRIVSVGEPLLFDLPHKWVFRFGHMAQLMNNFGQTETTGMVATYPIPRDAQASSGVVPIGPSIPETKLYVLDTNLKPVPIGEQGELYISSPCLARGYLNSPDLTSAKFISNPFLDGSSTRLYRTGDLARWQPDGTIEFMGRTDFQVKIRGQRLEMSEVESVLREHASVRECVVIARGDHPDEKYLIAYVIPANKTVTSLEIREFARNRLPEFMIPSKFVFLDEMPLTPSGKINRLALPDPSNIILVEQNSDSHTEPRNHIERTIVNIWKALLKLDSVGIYENYFDLGGNSLMSVRMFARIELDLGVRLPFTTLFQAATVAQIAELVASASEDVTQWGIVIPVQPYGDKPPFFGIHGHEGGVLFWRDTVLHLPKNQPFYALQALGVDGIHTPLNRIPDMASLYIKEMRKVQPHGPYYIGGYSLGGEIAFEMAQQLVSHGEKVDLLVMFDTRNPNRPIRAMMRAEGKSLAPKLDTPLHSSSLDVLKRKLAGHYLRLSMLGPRKQISYLANQIQTRSKRILINVLVKFYRTIGKRLPDLLLLRYLRESHSDAKNNYAPIVYPGKVTLFRATQSVPDNPEDSPMGWKPLAAGGLEVYYFEASHEIMRAEYAADIAMKLNECLEKARRSQN